MQNKEKATVQYDIALEKFWLSQNMILFDYILEIMRHLCVLLYLGENADYNLFIIHLSNEFGVEIDHKTLDAWLRWRIEWSFTKCFFSFLFFVTLKSILSTGYTSLTRSLASVKFIVHNLTIWKKPGHENKNNTQVFFVLKTVKSAVFHLHLTCPWVV